MNLIIGGSGFVGSRLILEIGKNNCLNLDKNGSSFFSELTTIGDIRIYKTIDIPENINAVVLLAAEHRDDVSPTKLYYEYTILILI